MTQVRVIESAVIDAPPAAVYAVLRDYHVGHPAILPPQFTGIHVETGGYGAGTIGRADMKVFGQKSSFRFEVSEPDPGRVLVEANLDGSVITAFYVEPESGGRQSHVTFDSEFYFPNNPGGWLLRWLMIPMIHRMYQEELGILNRYMRAQRPAPQSA
jgi:hypothetical protein